MFISFFIKINNIKLLKEIIKGNYQKKIINKINWPPSRIKSYYN